MNIGDRIRARREFLGLTQDDLAKKMGYADKSSISKIESSGNSVSLKKIRRIADALSIDPSELTDLAVSTEKDMRISEMAEQMLQLGKFLEEATEMQDKLAQDIQDVKSKEQRKNFQKIMKDINKHLEKANSEYERMTDGLEIKEN